MSLVLNVAIIVLLLLPATRNSVKAKAAYRQAQEEATVAHLNESVTVTATVQQNPAQQIHYEQQYPQNPQNP